MNNLNLQAGTRFMQIPILGYGIAVLILVAVVLGASTLVGSRRHSWKVSFTQGLGSLLWASPVIAVLAFVGMRIVPYFQFGTCHQQTANPLPTWLQSEEGSTKVHDVAAFEEQTVPISVEPETSVEASLPDWTSHAVLRLASTKGNPRNEVWRVVRESGWEKSVEAARENLLAQAAKLVQEDFNRFHRHGSALPQEEVKHHVLRAEAIKSQLHQDVDEPFTMYKVYWQVELSPEVRQELSGSWKKSMATQRAWLLGGLLALLTLISVSFAAYFHLDRRSQGTHRFRLKLAATALMTAGGLVFLAKLPYV